MKKDEDGSLTGPLIFIIVGFFCGFGWQHHNSASPPNVVKGRDTIVYRDTAYVINVLNRFEIERDYEPYDPR